MQVKNILNDLKLIAFKEKYKENNLNFWLENFENNKKGNTFYLNFKYTLKEEKKPFTDLLNEVMWEFFGALRCENNSDLLKIEIDLINFNFNYKLIKDVGMGESPIIFSGVYQNYEEIPGDDIFLFFNKCIKTCVCTNVCSSLHHVVSENFLLGRLFYCGDENGLLDLNQFFSEIEITFEFIDEFNNINDQSTACEEKTSGCKLF